MIDLATRILFPLAWRLLGRQARMLFGFALAEQSSMLDIHAAALATTCDRRRALYLRHALDEGRHAHVFANLSANIRLAEGFGPLGRVQDADYDKLYERLGEARFLAFVHLGERRARRKFSVIQGWLSGHGEQDLAGVLAGIIRDEERHESYTHELLVDLEGPEGARVALRRALVWDGFRRWRRWGTRMAGKLYALLMILLYLVLPPLVFLVRVVRPLRPGWSEAACNGALDEKRGE